MVTNLSLLLELDTRAKRKSNQWGGEKKFEREKAQIFWEDRKNIPAVTGKFTERNQTSTDLEGGGEGRQRRTWTEWGELTLSRESVRYSCYVTRVRPSVVNDVVQLWLATRTLVLDGGQLSLRHGYCVSIEHKRDVARSDGYYSPDHPSAFSRGVCIRVESRMKRSPLSSFVRAPPPPSGNKPPKEFRKLDRVYTVERLHAKIEGNRRRFHE